MPQADALSQKLPEHLPEHLKIREILFNESSPFQEVVIAETERAGRVLFLNREVQLSALDENFYHEMLVHVPLNSLRSPKNVLIIGGGDGGTLREVLKYRSAEKILMVEIDEKVVTACNRYLPSINQEGKVYADPRVELLFQDGVKFVHDWNPDQRGFFDAILLDSSGFRGPSTGLFDSAFLAKCAKILRPEGVLVTQSGAPSLEPDGVRQTSQALQQHFAHTGLYLSAIPSYLCGFFGFAWASSKTDLRATPPTIVRANIETNRIHGAVYNLELHHASFALPTWYHSLLKRTL
jgi:spermidine synthase